MATNLPSFDTSGSGVESQISDGHIKWLFTMHKDLTLPDITDDTAIGAAIAAGTLRLSPVINGQVPTTSDSDPINEPCESDINLTSERVLTFTSLRTDTDGTEDFAYWDMIDCNTGDYLYSMIDCNGGFITNKDYTTGKVGFPMQGKVKPVWDGTKARKWDGELKWKEFCDSSMTRVILTADAKTAIGL